MSRFTWHSRADRDAEQRAEQELALRRQRDRKLKETDWTQLPDAPLDAAASAKWARYRQELRDLLDQAGDRRPEDVELPTPPQRAR